MLLYKAASKRSWNLFILEKQLTVKSFTSYSLQNSHLQLEKAVGSNAGTSSLIVL